MPQTQTMLEKVKLALRISSTSLDTQINDLIDAAILDMTKFADIKTFTTTTADALQTNAIIAYVSYKWYGEDTKYLEAYNNLKMQMSTSSYYRPAEVVPDV